MTPAFNYHADNAGRVPAEGDYVAYNYSGNIATGFIRKIGRGKRGGIYYITQVLPEDGHESVVRGGPKCVLVLNYLDVLDEHQLRVEVDHVSG